MSGNFAAPQPLTGGAGYKAPHLYDSFLRKHSATYRRSSVGKAMEDDRRASQVTAADAAAATEAVQGGRRGSVAAAMAQSERKGSIAIDSPAGRKESIYGLEATAGTNTDPNRRPSTSLAADLFHKMKGK